MYKVMLSWFVIVSCFVFFVKGEEVTQAPTTQTDCDKFLHNCTECLASTLNCTFCMFQNSSSGLCTNLTVCKEPDTTPVQNKSKCPEVPVPPTTVPTPDTTSAVTVPVTPKTESPTEASSSDASEGTTTTTSKPSPAPSGRHFDPPSFIGGTVLSLGLLAIVYVGFKFYKARTERNYHTL